MSELSTYLDSKEAVDVIKETAWKSDSVISSDVLEALRAGSHDAYRSVYLTWRKPIYQLLLKLTGSPSDAEDISQDVFIRLWENRSKIDPEKNIKSLIYLIARHLAIHHFERKRSRNNYNVHKSVSFDLHIENGYDIVVAKETELLKEIALSRMSEQRRNIYRMSVEEGFNAEQIAESLGLSPQTVYNQLSSARRDLKELVTLFVIFFAMP